MLRPRPRSSRRTLLTLAAGLILLTILTTGCTTSPKIGAGSLTEAKDRVVSEVNDTVAIVGGAVETQRVTADPLACTERLLGYTVRHLSEHRAEVRDPLMTTSADGASLLPQVERRWKALGYTVDRSGLSDHHFPKIRTHIGSDLVIVTGYVGNPRINFYSVSPCVKG